MASGIMQKKMCTRLRKEKNPVCLEITAKTGATGWSRGPSTFLSSAPNHGGAARLTEDCLKVPHEPERLRHEAPYVAPAQEEGPAKTLLCCLHTHCDPESSTAALVPQNYFSMCYYLTSSCEPPAEEKAQKKC